MLNSKFTNQKLTQPCLLVLLQLSFFVHTTFGRRVCQKWHFYSCANFSREANLGSVGTGFGFHYLSFGFTNISVRVVKIAVLLLTAIFTTFTFVEHNTFMVVKIAIYSVR